MAKRATRSASLGEIVMRGKMYKTQHTPPVFHFGSNRVGESAFNALQPWGAFSDSVTQLWLGFTVGHAAQHEQCNTAHTILRSFTPQ